MLKINTERWETKEEYATRRKWEAGRDIQSQRSHPQRVPCGQSWNMLMQNDSTNIISKQMMLPVSSLIEMTKQTNSVEVTHFLERIIIDSEQKRLRESEGEQEG